jgi:S-DNA-T family DNA segregation ATPase FtsK/SpoIIIE
MAKKPKKTKKQPQRPSSDLLRNVGNFLKSDDFVKIRAVCYMLLAVFLFVAILSFFFTGQEISRDSYGDNWLGKVGGCLSVFLVTNTFGFSALGFSLLLFALGLHLFRRVRKYELYDEGRVPDRKRKRILPWWPTFFYTLFWMAWISCVFGYISNLRGSEKTGLENFAGTFGEGVADFMINAIKIFTPVVLLVAAALVLVFGHHLKLPKLNFRKQQPEGEEVEPQEETPMVEEARKPALLQRIFGRRKDDEEPEPESDAGDEPSVDEEGEEFEPDSSLDDIHLEHRGDSQEEGTQTVTFDIDDEYGRAHPEQPKGNTFRTPVPGEPTFTVIDPSAQSLDGIANQESVESEEPEVISDEPKHIGLDEPYDPHLDLKDYQMPSVDMLEDWEKKNTKVTQEELVSNKDRIVETLRNYGIEVVEISASPGPTVTLYEIKPAPGIRISKIKGLENDIALSLSALGIRIIAPIPGKGAVGIEVPNAKPQIVSMKSMLSCDAFKNNTKMELPVAIGKTISNEPYVTDLAKMPHLLMAGATGTGKSVGLNAIIASLLYKKHPSELKFVMVDPKKVELSLYSKIERHYLAKMPDEGEAIITDVKKVVRTLNSLCIEMDQRYDLLKMAQVKKITEYNDKFKKRQLNPEHGHRFLPYIVLVIDEFADLIMTAGKEVELPICRLAQLARAVGIHLIIATQRPTTNIITGTIKTNFPARIAFRVTSAIDSRTILDTGGANQLIGRGDMLISLAGSDMVRLQCALIETEEIERLAEFIGEQRGYPDGFLLPEYLDENEEPNKDFDPKQKDEMFNDAARLVVASQFGSTSLLQRKLGLGYNRAGRIVDQLEAVGIVGPYNGSKAREVLIKDEVSLEELLRSL